MSNGSFQHCTFVNVSFKDATLEAFHFLNCIFIGCYFRRTRFERCDFVGCKFLDCAFPKLDLATCRFQYSTFRGCQIPFRSMKSSMSDKPNLRMALCRNLALESSKLAQRADARLYRIEVMSAREQHLLNAVRGESKWYQDHYKGFAKCRALFDFAISRLNKYLFGYGESLCVLVRNSLLGAFGLFPLLYYLMSTGFDDPTNAGHTYGMMVLFSASRMFPITSMSDISPTAWYTHAFAGLESICGVIVLAFVAAYVFRWSIQQ